MSKELDYINSKRKANKKLYQFVIKKKLGKRKRENETIRI